MRPGTRDIRVIPGLFSVGLTGFEPATPWRNPHDCGPHRISRELADPLVKTGNQAVRCVRAYPVVSGHSRVIVMGDGNASVRRKPGSRSPPSAIAPRHGRSSTPSPGPHPTGPTSDPDRTNDTILAVQDGFSPGSYRLSGLTGFGPDGNRSARTSDDGGLRGSSRRPDAMLSSRVATLRDGVLH